jgi:undecaprenyl-diphosphatase
MHMSLWSAIILGIVEGITEFLPVSSTGHLMITSSLLGYGIGDDGVGAFVAIIQMGAIAAVIVYFWRDIVRLARAWVTGLRDFTRRGQDYKEAWIVIIGSIPIGIIGFLARDLIRGPLRSLWVVAGALALWSIVMFVAERYARQDRSERDLTMRDAVVIGLMQCVALVPGVSRSGATISAGLFRGLDRVTATRVSFFLSIPSLLAAGAFEALTEADAVGGGVGWGATAVTTAISFVVAYAAIAWLLRLVAKRPISVFIWYRVAVAAAVIVLLIAGVMSAT